MSPAFNTRRAQPHLRRTLPSPPPPGSAPLPRPAGIAGRGNGGPHGPRVSPSADRRCREWGGAAEPGARLTAVGAGPRRPLPTGGAGPE